MAQKQPPVNIPFMVSGVTKVKAAFSDITGGIRKMNRAYVRGYTGDLSNTEKQLFRQNKTLKQTAQGWRDLSQGIGGASRKMRSGGFQTSMLVSMPVIAMMKKGINTAVDYEKSLTFLASKFNVIPDAGKTAAQSMGTYDKFIRKTASNSIQTAQDLLSASTVFAKAGFGQEGTMGAIPFVRKLATIEQKPAGQTAEQFRSMATVMDVDRTTEAFSDMADVISYISTNTAIDMTQLSAALSKGGGVMKAFGGDFAEASNVMGMWADIGLKGTRAGTITQNLQTYLLQDTKLSKALKEKLGIAKKDLVDKKGNIKSVGEILTTLIESFQKDGVTDLTRLDTLREIFKRRALPGIAAVLTPKKGADGIKEMSKAFNDFLYRAKNMKTEMKGMADYQEKLMETTVWSKSKKMTSALENLALAFGDAGALDAFSEVVVGITEVAKSMTALEPGTLKTLTKLFVAMAAAGPALVVMGSLGSLASTLVGVTGKVIGLVGSIKAAGGLVTWLGIKFGLFSAVMAPAAIVVGGIAAAIGGFYGTMELLHIGFTKLKNAIGTSDSWIANFVNEWLVGYDRLKSGMWSISDIWTGFLQTLQDTLLYAIHKIDVLNITGVENPFENNTPYTTNAESVRAEQLKMNQAYAASVGGVVSVNINNKSDANVDAAMESFQPGRLQLLQQWQ